MIIQYYTGIDIMFKSSGSTSFLKFLQRLGGDTRDYSEMKNVHEESNPFLK